MATFSWVLLATFALCAPSPIQGATFAGLGDLPGSIYASSTRSISGDGRVVVGFSSSSNSDFGEAFRWTATGGIVGLGDLPGGPVTAPIATGFFNSDAWGVSGDGSAVVGSGVSLRGIEAFRWTPSLGMTGLGSLAAGGPPFDTLFDSNARGVSADATIVVGSSRGSEAFRWTSGQGMVGLGDLPGGAFGSVANDVSGDGDVVVGFSYASSGTQAFRWTHAAGMTGLGYLPAGRTYSQAWRVSANGAVVVGQGATTDGFEAFRWTQSEGMVSLRDFPGYNVDSIAFGVSADGAVIVGRGTPGPSALDYEAFLWTADNGLQSVRGLLTSQGVNLAGWKLKEARDVSDDGLVVVGTGINPAGQNEAWIANFRVPEPCGGVLALISSAWASILVRASAAKAADSR